MSPATLPFRQTPHSPAVADDEIIGLSPAVATVLDLVARVAPTDTPVLIGGETGTGKELTAHTLHLRSRRAQRPFIAVNLAAIPDDLVAAALDQACGRVSGPDGAAARLGISASTLESKIRRLRIDKSRFRVRESSPAIGRLMSRAVAMPDRTFALVSRSCRFARVRLPT